MLIKIAQITSFPFLYTENTINFSTILNYFFKFIKVCKKTLKGVLL